MVDQASSGALPAENPRAELESIRRQTAEAEESCK
jgi:hypothetical protein